MDFNLPPHTKTDAGSIRKVGYEIEFSNVPLERVSAYLLGTYGGNHQRINDYNHQITDTSLGDFSIESDTRLLSEKMYQDYLKKLGIDLNKISFLSDSVERDIETLLSSVVDIAIPYEAVLPPLPLDKMSEAEKLRLFLYNNQAEGTKSSFAHIFGMHINPELPELSLPCILTYLRAFLLFYPWLHKVCEIDWTRRLSTYINPFPLAYQNLVLHPSYEPSPAAFIKDYHDFNPDRNRPLDLYPLFMWMWEDQVALYPSVKWVSKRPTLHYRLPNSLIGQDNWSLALEWNRWVKVEELAADPSLLEEMAGKFLDISKQPAKDVDNEWLEMLETQYHVQE